MNEINLRYINKSFDVHNEDVLIFLRNEVNNSYSSRLYAWKVIKNCGYDQVHPFIFPLTNTIQVVDSDGNHTQTQIGNPGDKFEFLGKKSGNQLVKVANKSESFSSVENKLERGSISVKILKDNRLIYQIKHIAPGQLVCFEFNPAILISSVSQFEEGNAVSSAVLSTIDMLPLAGLSAVDIVKRGGGTGTLAKRITFTLENEEDYV